MIKKIVFTLLLAQQSFGQSFAPPAGQPGSTAIHKDSSIIVDWANDCSVVRAYQNSMDPSLGFADFGDSSSAIGVADGTDVVSLGDGGSAIVTFASPITNGAGPDFAVFENGFSETFLELAFVEVSSDGIHFVRFPAVSETQTDTQIGGFGTLDCRYIHNLAGKYKSLYGTPFDLQDLADSVGLDINSITHVKLIDVVGSIDLQYGSQDYLGTMINDPFPTPFGSSGFDLDAVGVIHQASATINEVNESLIRVFPNPTNKQIKVMSEKEGEYELCDQQGRIIFHGKIVDSITIDLSSEENGVYLLKIITSSGVNIQRIIKQ